MQIANLELSDIDVASLKLHKVVRRHIGGQDHSRWVLSGPTESNENGRLYYKIWNASYVRRDNIMGALESGFYDDRTVPALRALIFGRGVCRGYVMKECRPLKSFDPSFFRVVLDRTSDTKYFAVQFGHAHSMLCGSAMSMIDLEGVYPIEELGLVRRHYSAFANARYAEFVTALYRDLAGSGETTPSDPPLERHMSWRRHPFQKALVVASKHAGRVSARCAPRLTQLEV
ncbi:hypothetical protein [Limimaricola sp. AA108-03]|uniref:hypothetical protein n=1 Tax=Limimaricola sp. AA108-03 TaxID=3425945 RepID=UPI003D786289